MNTVVIFCVLVGIVQSKPLQGFSEKAATILRFDNIINKDGFSYDVQQSDGTHQQATGLIINPGTKDESLDVHGSYSYLGTDGKTYAVEYTANDEGFQPSGTHLPPSAGVKKLGIPSSAIASLAGGGLG